MKYHPLDPPRRFTVGAIEISDFGKVALDSDEMVTFTTPAGGEYDVVRKSWGFYATPSVNGRLLQFGLRAALVRNCHSGRAYVMLVETGHETDFQAYLDREEARLVAWLDDESIYADLEK